MAKTQISQVAKAFDEALAGKVGIVDVDGRKVAVLDAELLTKARELLQTEEQYRDWLEREEADPETKRPGEC